jgi:DNA-binding MarR family transcriptional regulator
VQAKQLPPDQPSADGDHVDLVRRQWAAEMPELDTAPLAVIARLGRLRTYLDQGLDALFGQYGLTRQSWDVLACLRRKGKPYQLTPTELSRAVMRTSGTITHTLYSLEHAGLIQRIPSDADGRSLPVQLTAAGIELVERVAPRHLDNERELLAALGPDEQAQLAALLRTLLVALESQPPPEPDRRRRPVTWRG